MQDHGSGHDQAQVDDAAGREVPSAQLAPDQRPGSPGSPGSPAENAAQTQTQAWWPRPGRLALGIGAAVTAAIVAFAAFAAVGGLSGAARASSVIPGPPR